MVYSLICSWCGKRMGKKVGPANSFALGLEKQGLEIVSHGMCEACRKKVMAEIHSKDKGGNKDE